MYKKINAFQGGFLIRNMKTLSCGGNQFLSLIEMLYYTVAPLELCSLDDHLNKIMDIPPLTILNVTNVRAGVAEITFPTKGCVSLLNKNEKPVCKPVTFPFCSETIALYPPPRSFGGKFTLPNCSNYALKYSVIFLLNIF